MSGDLAFEDEYVALWQKVAQVIIGPPVAQPKFEHRARDSGDQVHCMAQAVALGSEAADEAVEAAH